MASIQFSGLSSGLDTAGIISKLMSVESAPRTVLKTRVATQQSQLAELQRLNTSVASLKDSAASFASGSTWTKLAATSSSPAVSVTASSSATPVQVDVTVGQVATSGRGYLSTPVAAGTALTVRKADGTAYQVKDSTGALVDLTVTSSDGSFAKLAESINATTQTSGLRAAIINTGTNGTTPMLMVTSAATGTTSNFSLTDSSGAAIVSGTGGDNAKIQVNGQPVTSASNTFTDLMPGVTITLGAGATGVTSTVSVADDGAGRATAMKAFVDQVNGILDAIGSATAYGTITDGKAATGGGVLSGDTSLRSISDLLIHTVLTDAATPVLAKAGLSVDRDGRLTFDSAKFSAAYAADPTGIQAAFVGKDSMTDRVASLATKLSDPFDGSLSGTIKNRQSEIDRANDQIAAWDDRLATRQASLEQQYTHLETMLSRLSAQQSWLTSQIESLDGLSGSKN